MKNNRLFRQTATMLLALAMVFTMMPLLGAQDAYAETAEADGGTVASNSKSNAEEAFGASNVTAEYSSKKLTIELKNDISLRSPVRFVKGSTGDRVVLDLNGHTITGKAGSMSSTLSEALGGNAIEIAADEFDVEIKGPGSVVGGKGGKLDRADYSGYRVGAHGGSAVFFCERVDEVHSVTETWGDIIDEGYHPDKLEHGLFITGGADLIGGAGSDVTAEDWKHNLGLGDEGLFAIQAGRGGSAIGQIFTSSDTADVLEELSYAKIAVESGTVTGGAGGGVDLGGQLLTTTDIQKIAEIQQFMKGKSAGYDFDSYVKDNIGFKPAKGGNGIEFFAGRKFIEVGSGGSVSGGAGGRFTCSEKASMVKSIETQCGDGGKGIYICGDTGLTNATPTLTADSWSGKSNTSNDVGIYVAGTVTGGASPSTTLLSDSSGAGGEGIDNDLEGSNLCKPYTVSSGHRPAFDADRGIVLIADGGKVTGGASGAPDEMNIAGGLGADAMNGGSTGGPTASERMSAAYFVVNGEVTGGYGSSEGGAGFRMKEEREDLDETQSSVYFGGVLYGNGTIRGGDSGEWPNIGIQYSKGPNGTILDNGDRVVRGEGIRLKYGSHEGATTIGPELNVSDGEPARLMTTSGTFSVAPVMTPFAKGTAPNANTRLGCKVTTPNGYKGKVYIMWSAECEASTPRTIRSIEGANGTYNNLVILSNSDYPYGWKSESYGGYTYHINVATRDHIAECIKYNDSTEVHIYCHVLLEDGRFIDNDDIWFSKDRRSSKGWGSVQPEETAVDKVKKLISALPEDTDLKLSDESAVVNARTAFDKLSDEEQTQVGGELRAKLENDEARLVVLKEADAVSTLIANLSSPDELEIGDEEAVNAARAAYDDLSAQAKALITKAELNKLETAEAVVEAKKQEAEDMIAASAVAERIGEIVIPEDFDSLEADSDDFQELKQAVSDASDAYNALSDEQKALIDDESFSALADAVGQLNRKLEEEERIAEPVAPQFTTITEDMITVGAAVYTGKALEPDVTVVCDGRTLIRSVDYEVAGYGNNVNAGKATVTVTGRKLYKGTVKKTFTISRKKVTPNVTLSPASSVWDNKTHKPKITVKSGATVLKEKRDYTTNVKKYRSIGNYSIKVTLTGNYSGSKTVTYKIVPKGTSIAGLSGSKKALSVRWKRQAARMPKVRVAGYQVQYSLRKDFKSAKAVTVKGYNTTAKKITRLNAKKTYYVRVRTYMKTGGKTYYSSWSKVKAARTK